jgi:hypothetical protein
VTDENLTAQRPAGDGCHCRTCACGPNMTPALRFDLSPAQKEGAIREHLIRLGWTPPNERALSQLAEIEALRAEVAEWKRVAAAQAELHGEAESRGERLAKAGRRVTAAFLAHGEALSFTRQAERTRHECEAAMLSLDDALRDHDQEAGNG